VVQKPILIGFCQQIPSSWNFASFAQAMLIVSSAANKLPQSEGETAELPTAKTAWVVARVVFTQTLQFT
jgi:hypothetical protein